MRACDIKPSIHVPRTTKNPRSSGRISSDIITLRAEVMPSCEEIEEARKQNEPFALSAAGLWGARQTFLRNMNQHHLCRLISQFLVGLSRAMILFIVSSGLSFILGVLRCPMSPTARYT